VSEAIAKSIVTALEGTKVVFTTSMQYWQEADYVYELEGGTIIREGFACDFLVQERQNEL
jgi:hypothetical protein